MRILLVNQFVPPDPAPTAKLLGDVGAELERRGHEVIWVGNPSAYRGKKSLFGSRALREATELGKILFKGWFSPRCERILFLTSPPFLPVIASMISWRHREARRVHWAMDVYPDVAIAVGETRPDAVLARITSRLMARAYRACNDVIALDEDMAARIARHGVSSSIQAPWPPSIESTEQAELKDSSSFRILYSGNLGRAHDWKTILDALELLEKKGDTKIELIFQGGGEERKPAQQYASQLGLKNCTWKGYVDSEQLLPSFLSADLLLSTQRGETKGCVWPSKLALSSLTGIPLLWIGPEDSAVSLWLETQGHHAFAVGDSSRVAKCIEELAASPKSSRVNARSVADIDQDVRSLSKNGSSRIADLVTL